ncbi:hypothetical protein [Microbacterium sp. SORGH_AS_0888]|uniref:hypothetical protein n=1 Tax=Microbacterium sp. SORGH_AS_0888 TaxID=3041791 RepID=UPI00278B61C8|nr:hypothetical protein [Microbacterium sp. SORGH_AS_0888]MDQ1131180.1 hypothetical protein [Microbacterium sp. SORGH_AS_0888]
MKKSEIAVRASVAALGGLLLAGVAGAAFAAEDSHGDEDIDVTVDIADEAGALTLSVAGTTAGLTENGSTTAYRQFTGQLPEVTVNDTRSASQVGANRYWYVLGQASDFSDGTHTIPAANLGWTPQLVVTDVDGFVAEGPEVGTALDGTPDVGLVDKELLFTVTEDSAAVNENQTAWSAQAALNLKTTWAQAPGSYSSTLTLSLWENDL